MSDTRLPWVLRAVSRHKADAPHRTAVECARGATSYGQLWADVSHTAESLRERGVRPGDVVAVVAERGAPFITAALACWKADAVYLPLAGDNPAERVEYMVRDSGARVALFSGSRNDAYRDLDLLRVPVSLGRPHPPAPDTPGPVAPAETDRAAYVLYTSGSTGRPKGVLVGHDSLANLVTWHLRAYEVTSSDRALHTASLGFDAAVWEIWPYLAAGATVVACSDDDRLVADFVGEQLERARCTLAFLATPLAEELLRSMPDLPDLRYLLTGGDVLRMVSPAPATFRLVNHYGPTEATVVTTAQTVGVEHVGGLPPIGAPIDGVEVALLGSDGLPAPEGDEGELYIGGRNLALGYLNAPELTAERFVSLPNRPGRWYRTGDIVAQVGDELVFRRRADLEQLKVRGVRVEAGEIEAALMACRGVRAAVVTMIGTGAHGALTAMVVADGERPNAESLRAQLRSRLQAAVVPNGFVFVDALPLNAHGKVDRWAVARLARDTGEQTGAQRAR